MQLSTMPGRSQTARYIIYQYPDIGVLSSNLIPRPVPSGAGLVIWKMSVFTILKPMNLGATTRQASWLWKTSTMRRLMTPAFKTSLPMPEKVRSRSGGSKKKSRTPLNIGGYGSMLTNSTKRWPRSTIPWIPAEVPTICKKIEGSPCHSMRQRNTMLSQKPLGVHSFRSKILMLEKRTGSCPKCERFGSMPAANFSGRAAWSAGLTSFNRNSVAQWDTCGQTCATISLAGWASAEPGKPSEKATWGPLNSVAGPTGRDVERKLAPRVSVVVASMGAGRGAERSSDAKAFSSPRSSAMSSWSCSVCLIDFPQRPKEAFQSPAK